MVFIEEKHSYLSSIADQPKQKALYALVSDESFVGQPNEVSETDAIYYSSIQAIKNILGKYAALRRVGFCSYWLA